MNIDEYRQKVIDLFKSGNVSDKQYEEMSKAVLFASESEFMDTEEIDKAVGI